MRTSLMVTLGMTTLGLSFAASTFAKSEASDFAQVKVANQAYYAALSARDLAAMERVWARSPSDVNVAPPIKPAAHRPGW